jgi:hypothetical protein
MTSKTDMLLNTPPVAVAGATVFGYTLPDIAAAVTIVYTLILVYFRLRKEWEKRKGGAPSDDDSGPAPLGKQ